MLGMSINTYSDGGQILPPGTTGDLVCDQHFPCQPLGFWPLEGYAEKGEGGEEGVRRARERYEASYYKNIRGVWCEYLPVFDCSARYEITDFQGGC